MKKTALFLALAMSAYTCHAANAVCGDLDDYIVNNVSFKNVSLQAGIAQLTEGMPFQLSVKDTTQLKISATAISGSFGSVLKKLATEAKFDYTQNKCLIEVSVPTPPPPLQTWSLHEGQAIGEELKKWGKAAGWTVIWDRPKDLSAAANATFTGDFKNSADEVIKILAANGVLIRAKFFDGNKTMVISGPGVTEQ